MKFGIFCSSIHEKKDLIRGNFAMKSSKTLRSIPLLDLQHNITKGQLISKCSHEMIVSSKIPTKFFGPSWGLPGSLLGLPVGFLAYYITH